MPKQVNKNIGLTIRALRAKNGWTLEDLGRKIKTSGQMIYFYETHKHTPGPSKLLKLAEVFKVSIGFLKGEVNNNLENPKEGATTEADILWRDQYNNAMKKNEELWNENRQLKDTIADKKKLIDHYEATIEKLKEEILELKKQA